MSANVFGLIKKKNAPQVLGSPRKELDFDDVEPVNETNLLIGWGKL